jgi:hypothetical protein
MTDVTESINALLEIQGLDLSKVIDHNALGNLLIECRDEIERLRSDLHVVTKANQHGGDRIIKLQETCHRQAAIIRKLLPESFPDTLFISSVAGKRDMNNMPEKILVCPAYGVDFSYIYEYTGKTTGPEW